MSEEPFDPIVESLLRWPVGSPQFAEALAVAGAAEIEEAHRQLDKTIPAFEDRQDDIDRRLGEPDD